MQINKHSSRSVSHVVNISRITRTISLILISIAMISITLNFHKADAVFAKASVLPVYILFFILMYMACILVEYISLWCERGQSFHCARVFVHCMALLLVTFEVGTFYSSDHDAYSHLPSYSITQVLSHIITTPADFHDARI